MAEDEVARLQSMLAGDGQARVRAAAHLGDEAAEDAIANSAVTYTGTDPARLRAGKRSHGAFGRWLVPALHACGREALIRAAAVAARSGVARWEEDSDDERPAAALRAVEAWLACPCEEHARGARGVARLPVGDELEGLVGADWSLAQAGAAAGHAADAVGSDALEDAAKACGEALECATLWIDDVSWEDLDPARGWPGDMELLRALRKQLVPWLLQRSGP